MAVTPSKSDKMLSEELDLYESVYQLENQIQEIQRAHAAQLNMLSTAMAGLHRRFNNLRIARGRPMPDEATVNLLGGTGTKRP